jgi:hypothetical protein
MLWLTGWKINMKYREHYAGKYNEAPHHEDMGGGSAHIAPPYLNLALHRGQLSASCPTHFIPTETALGTYWIGGQVDLRGSLDAMEKIKISCP